MPLVSFNIMAGYGEANGEIATMGEHAVTTNDGRVNSIGALYLHVMERVEYVEISGVFIGASGNFECDLSKEAL